MTNIFASLVCLDTNVTANNNEPLFNIMITIMNNQIKSISYDVKKMMKNIKRGDTYDVSRGLEKLNYAYEYFEKNEFKNTSIIIQKLISVLRRSSFSNMEGVSCLLKKIDKNIDRIIEKYKIMEIRHAESLIDYHASLSFRKKNGYIFEEVEKFDVIYAPTQGGVHMCVVGDILENGMALCYPFTSASERDLKMLGNRSWKIMECSMEALNGNLLSSSATLVDIKKAGYFKKCHLTYHEEIERALSYFLNEESA